MEITEVKVKLTEARSDRLQAFCTVTIDNDFVIRDLKVIEGAKGPFVAMPSRKLTDKCPRCGGKNHLRARYCNDCGNRLDENRAGKDERGRAKLHADIAHPINSECRERIQQKILQSYDEEVQKSKQPGYVPTSLYDDEDADDLSHFERGSFGEGETTSSDKDPYAVQQPEHHEPYPKGYDDDVPPLTPEEEAELHGDSPKKETPGEEEDKGEKKKKGDDFSAGVF